MINVSVGIILKAGQVFLAKRSDQQDQGGLWEFPGGKCELNEEPLAALTRELREEVGITVIIGEPFEVIKHNYGDKQVCLHFFVVENFSGEPHGAEGQLTRWVNLSDIHNYEFPKANIAVLVKLSEYIDK